MEYDEEQIDFAIGPVKIDLDQISDLYDLMAEKVYADMDKQYKEGKINGATYADTWAKLMDSVIAGSIQAIVSLQSKETDADRCLKQTECETKKQLADSRVLVDQAQIEKLECDCRNSTDLKTAEVGLKDKQGQLYERQKQGFDDNARQKLYDAQMTAWSMVYADTDLTTITPSISDNEIMTTYQKIQGSV